MMNQKRNFFIIISIVLLLLVVILYNHKNEDTSSLDRESLLYDTPFHFVTIPEDKDQATLERITDTVESVKITYTTQPRRWTTWVAIGNMYTMLEQYDLAISSFKKSIEITDSNVVGYRNIAEIYRVNIKDYNLAQKYYLLAITNNPQDPGLYISLSLLQRKQLGRVSDAEKTLLEGLENTQSNELLMATLVKFYEYTDQIQKQKEVVKALFARFPDNELYKKTWGDLVE